MIHVQDTLLVGGMKDEVDSNYAEALCNAVFEGGEGGLLRVVSAATGETLSEVRLESPPVWDGLAAAEGKLYMSSLNGQVVCMRGND